MRVSPIYVSCVCLVAISGCSLHAEDSSGKKVAQQVQSRGVMNAGDYQHIEALNNKLVHLKPLDDGDIDWCIDILHKPSQHPEQAQATVMGLFFDDRNMTASQKVKVKDAVQPFLSSQSKLARTSAQLAMKRLR